MWPQVGGRRGVGWSAGNQLSSRDHPGKGCCFKARGSRWKKACVCVGGGVGREADGLTVPALGCRPGKSFQVPVLEAYLYSLVPILIFLDVIYTERQEK